MTIFGYCLPWPYTRGDPQMPPGLTRAAYLKMAQAINTLLDDAVKCSDDAALKTYDVFAQKISKSVLQKSIDCGLVYLETASTGTDLNDKIRGVSYRAGVLAILGRAEHREKLLEIMRLAAERNKDVLRGNSPDPL